MGLNTSEKGNPYELRSPPSDPLPIKNFTPPLPTRERGLEKEKIFYREGGSEAFWRPPIKIGTAIRKDCRNKLTFITSGGLHISPLTARFKIRIKFKSTIKTRNAHRSPLSLILVNLETCLIKVIQRAEPVLASFHIRHKLKVCAYFCVSFTKSLNYIRRFIQQRVRNEWFGICRVGLFNVESSRK